MTVVPPQHGMQGPATTNPPQCARPHHHAIPNMVCKTVTVINDHDNSNNNGVVVGTLPMGDSGMAVAGMAATARHSDCTYFIYAINGFFFCILCDSFKYEN